MNIVDMEIVVKNIYVPEKRRKIENANKLITKSK